MNHGGVLFALACFMGPALMFADWFPEYRKRRLLDGCFVGTSEGGLALVVEPAPWHVRRCFWRAVYPTAYIDTSALYGAPKAVCTVVTARAWQPGKPLYECATLRRRFRR